MSEVAVVTGNTLPTQFTPEESKNTIYQAEAIKDWAKKMKNWTVLEEAVDYIVENQKELVRWWEERVGKPGGKGGGVNSDTELTIPMSEAETLTGFSQVQISRIRKKLAAEEKYRETLYGAAYRKAFPFDADHNHRAQGTGENEWYTPQEYIEAARDCLGTIELDPASSEYAQQTVSAENYYTIEDNGLCQDWHGKVWLNPPYSQPDISHFAEKMASEYEAGNVSEAIMLTHNYTDTGWFHRAASAASAILLTRGRIGFVNPEGEKASPTQGQAFFYYGNDVEAFAKSMGHYGLLVTL